MYCLLIVQSLDTSRVSADLERIDASINLWLIKAIFSAKQKTTISTASVGELVSGKRKGLGCSTSLRLRELECIKEIEVSFPKRTE